MKRFAFPLDRVLHFRRLEMERIQAHLSELAFRAHNERQAAEERRAEAVESGRQLAARAQLLGADFQIMGHWLARLENERNNALAESERLLQQHHEVLSGLVEVRRKVKLLETLRQRKLSAHEANVQRQTEAQAAEFYLAKRIRERRQ
jgi:hypothetical protein